VQEGYITISADVSTDADLSDEGGKQMYISKIENVLNYLKQMNIWDGKVVAIGYGMGACGLMDYIMRDTTPFNGVVLFGGDYTMRSGDFPESTADTKIVIHHGYKDQFEENDFPGLENALEAVGASYEIDFYGSHIGACFYDPEIQVCSKDAEEAASERYMCYDADADHFSWGQTKLFFQEIFEDLVPVAGPEEPCPEVTTLISPHHQDLSTEFRCADSDEGASLSAIDCVHPNILRAFPATCANFGDWAADLLDENCEPICEDLDPDCTDEVCSNRSEELDNIMRLSQCQRTCTTDGSCPNSNVS